MQLAKQDRVSKFSLVHSLKTRQRLAETSLSLSITT